MGREANEGREAALLDEIRDIGRRTELARVERGRAVMAGTFDFGPHRIPSIATAISDIDNGEKARKCVDDMGVLEAMLKRAGEYKQYSLQYLALECQMWIRISDAAKDAPNEEVRESFYTHLTRKEQNMLKWMGGKTIDEQMVILGECTRGRSVWAQRTDEVAVKNALSVEAGYENTSSKIMTKLSESGRTNCSVDSFFDNWQGTRKPNYRTVKAYVEKTRDSILRRGGVGLGDGSGTYVLPDHLSADEAGDAINARVSSIIADITSLLDLCSSCGLHLPSSTARLIRTRLAEVLDTMDMQTRKAAS